MEWNHIFRKANQVTGGLAKDGLTLDRGIKLFEFLPSLFVMLC
jgi:hypothetical protein